MRIDPGKSVGRLAIGMTREEYEAVVGTSDDVFKRTAEAPDFVVAYDDKLIHLTVDHARRIKSITVFRPEKVELDGIQLLGRDLASVTADLARTAFSFLTVDAGLFSAEAGVLLVEHNGLIDGVEVTASS